MAIYAVVLKNPTKKKIVIERIKSGLGLTENEIYDHSENVFLISLKEFHYITELVKVIGFTIDGEVRGFLVKISSINGFDSPNLWEWIEKDE